MIKRRLETIIAEVFQRSPAVALIGPRPVSKTTIAFNIYESTPSVYLDLKNPLTSRK